MCSETGVRRLGSVRRFAFGTLYCPEFTLCYPPRITVRGQTVQGVRLVLRKAPLRSMVYPWSTRRHCGPLAFRRATEGSRVQRKGWGVKRGRETLVSLPLLPPRRRTAAMHTPCHGEHPRPGRAFLASSGEPLYRRKVYRQQTVKFFKGCPTAVNTTVLPPVRQHPQDGIPLPAHISRGTTAHPQTRPPAPCRLARNYSAAPEPLHHNG